MFLGLFSAFEGEHLSRFISEKGRLEASDIGVAGFGISEKDCYYDLLVYTFKISSHCSQ